MSYSSGLKPLSELERLCVRRAVVFMLVLRGERAEIRSLMRGAGVNFNYEVTNDLYEYRDVLMGLTPRFVVDGESVGVDAFWVESLAEWEPRVEPGKNYCFDAVMQVAGLMLGQEFDGWESEECKIGLLCSCGGVFVCPSRRRVIEFLREAQAHTEFVSSEPVVAVLSVIQEGLVRPELPRPDGYDSEPYHKIWAWKGDAYIDGVLIPWACRRLGIWYEGDYELTKRVLSMTIEEPEEPEPVVSVAPEKGNGSETAGGKMKQVNVQVQASGGSEETTTNDELTETTGQGDWVTIEVGSASQPEPNADEEPVKRRSWLRRLFGV